MSSASDYMPIVRAILKMSSALIDADEIECGKYYKHDFKNKLNRWLEVFETLSNDITKAFTDDNEMAMQEAYEQFLHFKGDVLIKNQETTNIIIFYCKLKSSVNDLKKVPANAKGLLDYTLIKHTELVLRAIERQYSFILEIKDTSGSTISAITSDYDELGEAMFVNHELNEESK